MLNFRSHWLQIWLGREPKTGLWLRPEVVSCDEPEGASHITVGLIPTTGYSSAHCTKKWNFVCTDNTQDRGPPDLWGVHRRARDTYYWKTFVERIIKNGTTSDGPILEIRSCTGTISPKEEPHRLHTFCTCL